MKADGFNEKTVLFDMKLGLLEMDIQKKKPNKPTVQQILGNFMHPTSMTLRGLLTPITFTTL